MIQTPVCCRQFSRYWNEISKKTNHHMNSILEQSVAPPAQISRRAKFKRACFCFSVLLAIPSVTALGLGFCVRTEPTFEGKTLYRWSRELTASYRLIDRERVRKLGAGLVPHFGSGN